MDPSVLSDFDETQNFKAFGNFLLLPFLVVLSIEDAGNNNTFECMIITMKYLKEQEKDIHMRITCLQLKTIKEQIQYHFLDKHHVSEFDTNYQSVTQINSH